MGNFVTGSLRQLPRDIRNFIFEGRCQQVNIQVVDYLKYLTGDVVLFLILIT